MSFTQYFFADVRTQSPDLHGLTLTNTQLSGNMLRQKYIKYSPNLASIADIHTQGIDNHEQSSTSPTQRPNSSTDTYDVTAKSN